jgi:crotonobetainyl-CoA:carnitine CoA-transferase CaiB-like acyl-CoA transferase
MLVHAETGMIAVTGTPGTSTKTGVPNADVYSAISVLSAQFRRERTGEGAVVDVSMFDSTVELMGHPLYMQLYGGHQIPAPAAEPRRDRPYDAYPTADGSVLIGVHNDRGWHTLVSDVFGSTALADGARCATNIEGAAKAIAHVTKSRSWSAPTSPTAPRHETVARVTQELGPPTVLVNDAGFHQEHRHRAATLRRGRDCIAPGFIASDMTRATAERLSVPWEQYIRDPGCAHSGTEGRGGRLHCAGGLVLRRQQVRLRLRLGPVNRGRTKNLTSIGPIAIRPPSIWVLLR